MENYKLEAKTHGNITTLSALETKTEIINIGTFQYEQKTPVITEIGNYELVKKGKHNHVRVTSSKLLK